MAEQDTDTQEAVTVTSTQQRSSDSYWQAVREQRAAQRAAEARSWRTMLVAAVCGGLLLPVAYAVVQVLSH
jgi:hypothetical protein